MADRVQLGTIVRISLHGRRVRGWVVALDVEPAPGVELRPVAKVTGHGPAGDVIELARWARWRWAGRTVHFLRTASPVTAVARLPPPAGPRPERPAGAEQQAGMVLPAAANLAREGLARWRAVLRLPPAADVLPAIRQAAARGPTLVVAPSLALAADVAGQLRGEGMDPALVPRDWARAAAGARVVIGARAAAWAPVVDLAAAVVLDEHDEAHQEESSPTWNGRDVVAERARRNGAPCLWISPCPSLEALGWAPVLAPSRREERRGWPVVDVIDRRREEPLRAGLYSPRLVELLRRAAGGDGRDGTRMICVLNRKGRSTLLACAACAELARCPSCQAAVGSGEGTALACRRCAAPRPPLCLACGSSRLKQLRPGVRRVREDLERLAGVPVGEVTGDDRGGGDHADQTLLVGTEAVLHRRLRPETIAFLDLDAELLAPRYRAAEQALALLARAARLLGARTGAGRLVLQTRLPGHEVVQAALHADPGRVATAEQGRRHQLGFPPATALALVSGPPAPDYVAAVRHQDAVEVLGPADGRWLIRAADHRALCDALAAVPRPAGRLRVAVDPLRV